MHKGVDLNHKHSDEIHPDYFIWLAGFIDGEGSIGLYKEFDRRRGTSTYRSAIQITNTNKDVLFEMKSMLGCGAIVSVEKGPRHKTQYRIAVRNRECVRWIISRVIAHLRIKQEQAIRVWMYLKERDSDWARGWYKPTTDKTEILYLTMKQLNMTGKPKKEILNGHASISHS